MMTLVLLKPPTTSLCGSRDSVTWIFNQEFEKWQCYATALLTNDLLLMEFQDTIHEGDGDRVHRCYNFLMPHFHYTGHSKYALECFRYLSSLSIKTMS